MVWNPATGASANEGSDCDTAALRVFHLPVHSTIPCRPSDYPLQTIRLSLADHKSLHYQLAWGFQFMGVWKHQMVYSDARVTIRGLDRVCVYVCVLEGIRTLR